MIVSISHHPSMLRNIYIWIIERGEKLKEEQGQARISTGLCIQVHIVYIQRDFCLWRSDRKYKVMNAFMIVYHQHNKACNKHQYGYFHFLLYIRFKPFFQLRTVLLSNGGGWGWYRGETSWLPSVKPLPFSHKNLWTTSGGFITH